MASSFTTIQIEALEKAIADGVTEVRYEDKWVRYRSLDEMIRILDLMKSKIEDKGTCPKTTRVRARFSKGLC